MRIKHGSRGCTAFISPFGTFQYISFGLAIEGTVYSRVLNVAMKEVDRDFWTSYLYDLKHTVSNPGLILDILHGGVGHCDEDTIMQNQTLPDRGGVPGTQDQ